MAREIISGTDGRGRGFVFIGNREDKTHLARRWFNYGFNAYVDGECSRSAIDYHLYLEHYKADDKRGRWVKKWAEYGFKAAILYFEVLGYEGSFNAFRYTPEFGKMLNLDYTIEPPLNPDPYGTRDYDGWFLIRANESGKYATLSKHKLGELDPKQDEVMSYLMENVPADKTEWVNVFWWVRE